MRTAKRVLTVISVSVPLLLGATATAMAGDDPGGSPTQQQNQDEIQVSKPTNNNVSPSVVVQQGNGDHTANTGPTQTNNADQAQAGDWEDNTQAQAVGPDGSPVQVQNQDEVQVSKPTNNNNSPSVVVQQGDGSHTANTGPTQTNNANQDQDGDWDGNAQVQEVAPH
ncbi:hypothetical protein OU415_18205 [Saccharopolyspora sp. WRP15-2]|uniref:Secreted protein n=1 Tax=Saccharopolyspora oryzae TaxID=2997343 RepID=A0ABT4V089_9PSEU|nr:hypothetical protein [Saccharopolyspora oryzae]MDA3627385.1 hypothetical protein [Saccharopolyspora oryzae]